MAERVVAVKLSAQVAEFKKGMLEAAQATRTVGTEAEKLAQQKQAFEQMGRGLVIAGGAITAVTALAVKAAIDWESAWAGVTKTVDGSAEQMAELEGGLRELARTLPATHQEIAAVAEAAGQLGVAREDVVDFTKTMIDLSETTNLSADEAATSIAQLMNVMQTAPEDVDNLGAALVALGNDGASTERDIIQMAQRIAGAGKTIGLSEAQVLGFANALASVGIDAEAGGSSISRIMTDIAMAVSSGGEELDKFARVAGMSSADFQKAFKEAPAEAIATFIEGLGRINSSGGDVFKTLSDLGQTDIRVSQALLGMANSGDLLRKSLDLGSEAWDENTALAVEAAKRYETTEAKIQIAGNAIRDAAIDFGQVFLPAVRGAAEGIADFAKMIGDLPDPVQGLVAILGSAVGGLALLGGTALLAVPKIAEFKNAMDTLGLSMKAIGVFGGGALVALTAVITVVGMLAAAQAEAQQKAESYMDTLAEGTNRVTNATREMVKQNLTATDSWSWLTNTFSGSAYDAAEKLGLSLELVTDAAAGNADALKELAKQTNNFDAGGQFSAERWRELGMSQADYTKAVNAVEGAVKGESASIDEAIRVAEQKQAADKKSASSSDGVTASTDAMAEATQAATTAVDDLKKALDDVGGTAMDMGEAVDRAQGTINDLAKAAAATDKTTDELGNVISEVGVTMDGTNDASLGFRDALRSVEESHRDAAKTIIENGGTFEEARAEWDKGREAIINQITAMGLSRDEAVAWADQNLGSAAEVQQSLGDVAAAVNNIPPGRTINLQVMGYSETYQYLGNIQDRLRQISGNANLRIALGPGGQGGTTAYANGGIEDYAFASGNGINSGIFRGGPPIYKFAEPETGWEAFISGKPSERSRNVGIWQETGRRLGVEQTVTAQSGPVYVQNPWTGEYLLAKTADVASGVVSAAARAENARWAGGEKSL